MSYRENPKCPKCGKTSFTLVCSPGCEACDPAWACSVCHHTWHPCIVGGAVAIPNLFGGHIHCNTCAKNTSVAEFRSAMDKYHVLKATFDGKIGARCSACGGMNWELKITDLGLSVRECNKCDSVWHICDDQTVHVEKTLDRFRCGCESSKRYSEPNEEVGIVDTACPRCRKTRKVTCDCPYACGHYMCMCCTCVWHVCPVSKRSIVRADYESYRIHVQCNDCSSADWAIDEGKRETNSAVKSPLDAAKLKARSKVSAKPKAPAKPAAISPEISEDEC
jgi:hypothetical protein